MQVSGRRQSQDEINVAVKRKIAQLKNLVVQLVFGTDVLSWSKVTSHAWKEAGWVRELGMPPMAVLKAMTLDAARMMGADRDADQSPKKSSRPHGDSTCSWSVRASASGRRSVSAFDHSPANAVYALRDASRSISRVARASPRYESG